MPRTPKDFSDFKPPWGDDPDSIDPDQLARLIHSLRVSEDEKTEEVRTLKKSNEELTSANEVFKAASDEAAKEHSTEVQKAVKAAETERDQAKDALKAKERENDLLKIRVEVPELDEKDLERLKGDDFDALLEDAKEFAARIAPATDPADDPDDNDATTLVRRQPRIRTPLDPEGGKGPDTSVDKYLEQRAAQSSWVS